MGDAKSLGFRNGTASVHTSRTMMLDELSLVLDLVGPDAKADDYLSAIVVRGKLPAAARPVNQKRLPTPFSSLK